MRSKHKWRMLKQKECHCFLNSCSEQSLAQWAGATMGWNYLKFVFFEKATKFEKIFVVLLTRASCSVRATAYLSKSQQRFFKTNVVKSYYTNFSKVEFFCLFFGGNVGWPTDYKRPRLICLALQPHQKSGLILIKKWF